MESIMELLKKFGAELSLEQLEDFKEWFVNDAIKNYKNNKMDKRIVIENQIKQLGLRLLNGTVKKDYKAELEIPATLVDEVWVEGLEAFGLQSEVINDNEQAIEVVAESPKEEPVDSTVIIVEEHTDTAENGSSEEAEKLDEAEPICANNDTPSTPKEIVNKTPEKFYIRISGKPTNPGDFFVKLCFKYKGWVNGEEVSTINLPIAFNADPRTLWKDIPTPKDLIFFKPDTDTEYLKVEDSEGTGPRKDIVAASQRGRSHAQEGKARDDHFTLYHSDESDWYIIAVADGAGSAKVSRKGSEIACNTVVDYCKEQLMNCEDFESKIRAYYEAEDKEFAHKQMANVIYHIVGNAAFKAHKAIKEAADANDSFVPKDFATTLMFAICKKFDFGWFVASYWVGDGAMCILNTEKNTFKMLGKPDEGEFSGQTRFLTMPEIFKDAQAIMDRLKFHIEEDFTALMLMTDGVSDPMFETDNNLNSYAKWEEFWNKLKTGFPDDEIGGVELTDDNEESKNQLLQWLTFWSPGNHDDRTIAILY